MRTGEDTIPEDTMPVAVAATHGVGVAAGPAAGPAVLVVDDTEANRDALSRRLERKGYSVTTAADGAEALRQLAERPFDLVILDVMMPGMSGLEVLEQIRRDRTDRKSTRLNSSH